MQIKWWLGLSMVSLLLSGCSSTSKLTAAGERVNFTDRQPGKECQYLGVMTGKQSNWFSGTETDSGALRGAANELRNQAAQRGGNTLYGVTSPSQDLLSNFYPKASTLTGQVYKCP